MISATPQPTPFGRALRNVGWLLTGKGVGAVLSLVYLALATRSLGIAGFGQFALILATAQAASALAGFQTWQIVVRYGATHLAARDRVRFGRLLRFSLRLDLGGAVAGCTLAGIALLAFQRHFGWSDLFTRDAFGFCGALLVSVRSTAIGILRVHDRYALAAAADSVTPIVRFAGALLAVWYGATVTGFLIAWAASEVLTAITYWIAALRIAPGALTRNTGAGDTGPGAVTADNPGLWRFALVSNLNSALTAASRQFVVLIVGLVTGPAAAGAYRLAWQLSQSLVRAADMFSYAVLPEVSRTAADVRFGTLLRQSSRLSLVAGLVACVIAPVLGKPLILLTAGNDYAGVYPILVCLGIAAGFDIAATGLEPLLVGTGHAGRALRARGGAIALLFGGIAWAAPRWGAMGAAAVTVAASVLALALFAIEVRRLVRDAAEE